MCGSELNISLPRALLFTVVILGISAVPVFLVQYPPLVDYPLNLARIHILNTWSASPFLQEIYTLQSFMLPNIALDAISIAFPDAIHIETTGKISIFLIMTVTVTGVGILHYSLFRRISFWPLIFSGFLLYNYIFFLGFLNYLLGTGLMLWCFALWIMLETRPPFMRVMFGAVTSLMLFYSHLIAFGLYGIAVTAYGLQRSFSTGRLDYARLLKAAFVTFVSFLLPIIVYFGLLSTSGDLTEGYNYQSLSGKLVSFLFTPTSLNWQMDVIVAVYLLLFLILSLHWAKVRIARDSMLVLASFFLAFLVLPIGTSSGYHLDDRIPIAFLFVLAASMSISIPRRSLRRVVVFVSIIIFAARVGAISKNWLEWDKQYAGYISTLDRMRPNSVLFIATETYESGHYDIPYGWLCPPTLHVAELASVRKSVFVPAVFADPVTHTISVARKYEDVYELQGNNPIVVNNTGELQKLVDEINQLYMQIDDLHDYVYLIVFRTSSNSVMDWNIKNAHLLESTQQLVLLRLHENDTGK